jgi:hypothetical protein
MMVVQLLGQLLPQGFVTLVVVSAYEAFLEKSGRARSGANNP